MSSRRWLPLAIFIGLAVLLGAGVIMSRNPDRDAHADADPNSDTHTHAKPHAKSDSGGDGRFSQVRLWRAEWLLQQLLPFRISRAE